MQGSCGQVLLRQGKPGCLESVHSPVTVKSRMKASGITRGKRKDLTE
jgi:hypothetical protein